MNGTPVRKVFTPKGRSTREQSSLSFPCLNWTKDLENACRENSQVRSLTSTSSYLTLESKQPRPPVCKHLRSPGLRQQGDKLESHTCIGLIFFSVYTPIRESFFEGLTTPSTLRLKRKHFLETEI